MVLLGLIGVAVVLGVQAPNNSLSATTTASSGTSFTPGSAGAPASTILSDSDTTPSELQGDSSSPDVGVSSTSSTGKISSLEVGVLSTTSRKRKTSSTSEAKKSSTASSGSLLLSSAPSGRTVTGSAQISSAASVTTSTLHGYPTILRMVGSHPKNGGAYLVQANLVKQYSQIFAAGNYWITNTATNQVINIARGSIVKGSPAKSANVFLAPRGVSKPISLTWSSNVGRVAGAIFSDGSTSSPHCASAQWERQIAGFDRAVASYLCAGSNGTENNGQSWALLTVDDAKKITMPVRTDSVVTNMPTDVFSVNLVSERGLFRVEDPWKQDHTSEYKRASASNPSQLYMIVSNAHLTDMYTTTMLGANYSAGDYSQGIALTDFDPTNQWQYWTFEEAL